MWTKKTLFAPCKNYHPLWAHFSKKQKPKFSCYIPSCPPPPHAPLSQHLYSSHASSAQTLPSLLRVVLPIVPPPVFLLYALRRPAVVHYTRDILGKPFFYQCLSTCPRGILILKVSNRERAFSTFTVYRSPWRRRRCAHYSTDMVAA